MNHLSRFLFRICKSQYAEKLHFPEAFERLSKSVHSSQITGSAQQPTSSRFLCPFTSLGGKSYGSSGLCPGLWTYQAAGGRAGESSQHVSAPSLTVTSSQVHCWTALDSGLHPNFDGVSGDLLLTQAQPWPSLVLLWGREMTGPFGEQDKETLGLGHSGASWLAMQTGIGAEENAQGAEHEWRRSPVLISGVSWSEGSKPRLFP